MDIVIMRKTWIAGAGTLVFTIPKELREFGNIGEGDIICVTLHKLNVKQESNSNQQNVEKIDGGMKQNGKPTIKEV